MNKPDENTPLKVFFITSNEVFNDKHIQITADKKWMENLKRIFTKPIEFKGVAYISSIYCFTFTQKNLSNFDYDQKVKKYKASVKLNLNFGGRIKDFEGKIFFKKEQNNIIYDFKFEKISASLAVDDPPNYIPFAKIEQLKIYGEYFKSKGIKQDNPLTANLILDS